MLNFCYEISILFALNSFVNDKEPSFIDRYPRCNISLHFFPLFQSHFAVFFQNDFLLDCQTKILWNKAKLWYNNGFRIGSSLMSWRSLCLRRVQVALVIRGLFNGFAYSRSRKYIEIHYSWSNPCLFAVF